MIGAMLLCCASALLIRTAIFGAAHRISQANDIGRLRVHDCLQLGETNLTRSDAFTPNFKAYEHLKTQALPKSTSNALRLKLAFASAPPTYFLAAVSSSI